MSLYFQMYVQSHVLSVSSFDLRPQRLDDMELRQREDGTHVVRKTYYTWAYALYNCEVQAYMLLQDHGTPHLEHLQHWLTCLLGVHRQASHQYSLGIGVTRPRGTG